MLKKIINKLHDITLQNLMGTITHVSTDEPVVALTFDDGPHPQFTPQLLKILDRHQAYATFFILGEFAQQYPELVQQIAAAGHALGNHSWDHPSFPLIKSNERQRQVKACSQAISPYDSRQLFRPPYGEQSFASRLDTLRLGYQTIAWNVDVGDWRNPNIQEMTKQLIQQLKPGCIVLMHDAIVDRHTSNDYFENSLSSECHIDRNAMLATVDQVLETLSGQFRFVTIPELLKCGRPQFQQRFKICGQQYKLWQLKYAY